MQFNLSVYGGIISFVADVNIDDTAVLRLRICGRATCRAVFTICVSCDRGQRYYSPERRRRCGGGSDMTPTVATSKVT